MSRPSSRFARCNLHFSFREAGVRSTRRLTLQSGSDDSWRVTPRPSSTWTQSRSATFGGPRSGRAKLKERVVEARLRTIYAMPLARASRSRLGACRRERRSAQSALLPDGIARRPWGRDLPRRTYSNRRYSSRAFCTCRRFSACSKITERGDSIASAVISSPRTAGRQCSRMAVDGARSSRSRSTV